MRRKRRQRILAEIVGEPAIQARENVRQRLGVDMLPLPDGEPDWIPGMDPQAAIPAPEPPPSTPDPEPMETEAEAAAELGVA